MTGNVQGKQDKARLVVCTRKVAILPGVTNSGATVLFQDLHNLMGPNGPVHALSHQPVCGVAAITFKPLKTAPVAELSIASLSLQGSAGRMITFDPLVAFKTIITP